jgi:hypothetical protein
MKFVITIDTEEDNWGNNSRNDNPCSNIEQLLPLQEIFDSFNVIPTYLLSFPVVNDPYSQKILGRFLIEGKCEIGTHCHPWNTPPFEEQLCTENTMLSNLPGDLVFKKISYLHNAIVETFGITPVAFRGGRFAFDSSVAKTLVTLGYKIDTSITPYEDQSCFGGPDFSDCTPESYVFSEKDIFTPDPNGQLVEIPLSTGFLQNNFQLTNSMYKFFHKPAMKRLKIAGILSRLHLLNRACLCPETWSEKTMIDLAKVFLKKRFNIVNLMFHSTSLKAGLSPFAKSKVEEARMFHRIKSFLQFARDNDIVNIKVSEAANIIRSVIS